MFDQKKRHRQLMAELAALEAKDAGISSAQIIPSPKEKLSLGKALFFLGGLGAAIYYFAFSGSGPFDGGDEKAPKKDEPGTSKHIIEQIKFGKMDEVEK